jgi:hypothetical protein
MAGTNDSILETHPASSKTFGVPDESKERCEVTQLPITAVPPFSASVIIRAI